ncbi:MAG: penicillin-binding protein 2 [Candidatus Kerfeldbacteria bacterium]|nr:penicillin-binding protein 2 [Candidatus Kerfeldbacteria bacterium]
MVGDPFHISAGRDVRKTVVNRSHDHAVDSLRDGSDSLSLTMMTEQRRIAGVFIGFLVILGIFTVRLLDLQVVRGQTFRDRSEHNRLRLEIVPAPRGEIRDRRGTIIAQSVPDFSVTIVPADVPTDAEARQSFLTRLADTLHIPVETIITSITDKRLNPTEPRALIDHVSYEQALTWIVQLADLPGVGVLPVPTRSYPYGPALANVLGYIGKISPTELADNQQASPLDSTGKVGLERMYNEQLTGLDGQKQVERDVFNREQQVTSQRPPEPGQTLVTTIDAELQQRLFDRLSQAVTANHSPGGAAVALDPTSGQVLALVSVPSYDDNWFVTSEHSADVSRVLTDPKKPLLNRAISGQYPSGSIIKPILAAAALAEHVITPSTTVVSVGGFKVGSDFFPDWKSGGHGVTNVLKAIAESVNTFFYEIGGGYEQQAGLGVDRIVRYLSTFGWGSAVGIDMPGEADGFLPTSEWRTTKRASPWKLGDTYHLSIGQGDVDVTPLQIAASTAAIANGGTLYQPYLVQEILSPENTSIKKISPHVLNASVAPASALATVRAGMRQGVLAGSSRQLQSLPVPAAGKTGTAQFGNQGKTHAWYSVFAPYEHPQIVLAIIVEAGGEGNVAAEPVAKDILQWYFTRP